MTAGGLPRYVSRGDPIRAALINDIVRQLRDSLTLRGSNGVKVRRGRGGVVVSLEGLPIPASVAFVAGYSTPGPAFPSAIEYELDVVWPRPIPAQAFTNYSPASHEGEVEVWAAPLGSPAIIFRDVDEEGVTVARAVVFGEVPAWEACGASPPPAFMAILEAQSRRIAALEARLGGVTGVPVNA